MLNGLGLFSGIGGAGLALKGWVRFIVECEVDEYCQRVLCNRQSTGDLDRAPIWEDVNTLSGLRLPKVDIIVGGFPCQDISVAGNGAGLEGERSGLFFQVLRLVDEINPPFVFLENVPAIRTRGGERVVKELSRRGYDCRWDVISAFDVGANHLRKRWFLLGFRADALGVGKSIRDAECIGVRQQSGWSRGEDWQGPTLSLNDGSQQPVADSRSKRLQEHSKSDCEPIPGSKVQFWHDTHGCSESLAVGVGQRLKEREQRFQNQEKRAPTSGSGWWAVEPSVCRISHGVPRRVDRVKSLGNAWVPAQAREAFERLMGLKR